MKKVKIKNYLTIPSYLRGCTAELVSVSKDSSEIKIGNSTFTVMNNEYDEAKNTFRIL